MVRCLLDAGPPFHLIGGARSRAGWDVPDWVVRISREQLERISHVAKRQGIPRASYIKRSVFIQLEADEQGK